MKQSKLWIPALAALSACALHAQNINGIWQGALKAGPQELRTVVKISVDEKDHLKAVMYSIDQGGQPINATTLTQDGSAIKMTIAPINGTYEGRVNAEGNAITGNWNQGGPPLVLNLVKATPETAWTIPEPPPPPVIMSVDANPGFEVATIKPSKPEERFSLLVNRSGMLNTTATTVADLLKFAYDLHTRQITGGPAWLETEHFTISAKPDTPGIPNARQLKLMVRKLLAERFELTFHQEKKDLSVYAITVVKTGPKLTKDDSNPNGLPGFGRGPKGWNVRNSTIGEFATVLQAQTLDRPVVDQTGLGATRYDFVLNYTPDTASLPPGIQPPPGNDNADAPPDIFLAIQQQLGLKLESIKAPTDVLVIDKIEKPSAN